MNDVIFFLQVGMDRHYQDDHALRRQPKKPSRDSTRPLGLPMGLKGLLHTLNAIVIPTKVLIDPPVLNLHSGGDIRLLINSHVPSNPLVSLGHDHE
ncbi:hypothetical protein L1987_78842 [Smallanthus sonchifolius]|uniref:Uncharacterized protein n=1 Tax=Smallanthus sonchifolius TaxID=185202 RepID=A0ACB8ZDS5_9ASTR|nr:hypothetical protein L1987_78842 [Smallanthus sonchifolius]